MLCKAERGAVSFEPPVDRRQLPLLLPLLLCLGKRETVCAEHALACSARPSVANMGDGIVWAGGQPSQIAAQLPAILRWALGAEHDVRVASVAFLVSLGASAGRGNGKRKRKTAHSRNRLAYHIAVQSLVRAVRLEGPLEVPLAGLDVQMREWLRNASTVSATASAGPSCRPSRRVTTRATIPTATNVRARTHGFLL